MRPNRKAIPLGVKLDACLILLGFENGQRDVGGWDHTPPLGLRPVNAAGTDYDPPQLDPGHIQPLRKADHAAKTTGRVGTSKRLGLTGNGDVSRIRKAERLEKRRTGAPAKPKRKIPKRVDPWGKKRR